MFLTEAFIRQGNAVHAADVRQWQGDRCAGGRRHASASAATTVLSMLRGWPATRYDAEPGSSLSAAAGWLCRRALPPADTSRRSKRRWRAPAGSIEVCAWRLSTTSNFAKPDDAFRAIVEAHRGLSEAESADLDAALVLVLANHIGDIEVLREAIALAKRRHARMRASSNNSNNNKTAREFELMAKGFRVHRRHGREEGHLLRHRLRSSTPSPPRAIRTRRSSSATTAASCSTRRRRPRWRTR